MMVFFKKLFNSSMIKCSLSKNDDKPKFDNIVVFN